jgi:hypothetical protein
MIVMTTIDDKDHPSTPAVTSPKVESKKEIVDTSAINCYLKFIINQCRPIFWQLSKQTITRTTITLDPCSSGDQVSIRLL